MQKRKKKKKVLSINKKLFYLLNIKAEKLGNKKIQFYRISPLGTIVPVVFNKYWPDSITCIG